MNERDGEVLVNIKTASVKTGISEFVLRAWEQRYNAVSPQRSKTNRRLYSSVNIERLNLLRTLVDNGYPISSVAGLPGEKLRELCIDCRNQSAPQGRCPVAECERRITELYNAARNLDRDSFIRTLKSAFAAYEVHAVIKNILIPYLTHVGEKWQHGELDIYREHFSTQLIKGVLMELISSAGLTSEAGTLVFAAPERQNHTLGLLMAALAATRAGKNCIYMGGNLPAEELLKVINDKNVNGLVLALIHPSDDAALKSSLKKLVSLMPPSKRIIFTGSAAANYWSEKFSGKVILSKDYDSFAEALSLC
ncbi:MAG: MerR family transcriptional regulator [Ignavibacteriaceae bacterium]|nr:MerR family transcriptional regulator [Ignavibacteriaceae bacterium]